MDFRQQKQSITIPANTHASFLLDQSFYTNAYPELDFSKGKDAGIYLLMLKHCLMKNQMARVKHLKKEIEMKLMEKSLSGRKDSIISNGKDASVLQYT